MKVLITSSIYPTPGAPMVVGGAEIFVRRLAESLRDAGDEVEVVRAASSADQPMESCNGINVHSAPVQNIYPPFTEHRNPAMRGIWHMIEDWQSTASLVSERIRAFRPDVLHSNNLSGLTTSIWRSSSAQRVPVLHTLHDYYLTCPRCSRFSQGHACDTTCMSCEVFSINRRRATRWLDAVVGVSKRVLDIHTRLGLFERTRLRTVIPNASTASFAPQTRVCGPQEVAFGFIGRLTVEKGIDNLVEAMAAVPPDRARLVVAGRVSDRDKMRLKAKAPQARIEFLGFVPPDEFYRQVDVVVAPSIWEDPGPLVVADAAAAGRPVLGTRYGGMPEAIEPGVNGWLTEADPASLSRSMLSIASEPARVTEMIRALTARQSPWRFADVVSEYRKLYATLSVQNGKLQ
jgi:glycosyltransferase involved in cell wall biosynthesis